MIQLLRVWLKCCSNLKLLSKNLISIFQIVQYHVHNITNGKRTKWKNKEGEMLLLCFKYVDLMTIIV
jgi:hypothetical protein